MSRLPRTLPLTELLALWDTPDDIGVCGGVVRGRVGGCAELAAVTRGTDPNVGVGLLMTVCGCWVEERVATEEVELDRAGLEGRGVAAGWEARAATGPGLVFTTEGDEIWLVGAGVWLVDGAVETTGGCGVDTGLYCSPNSPGENDRVEQKPSEELMIKVNPSCDLHSVSKGLR